MRFVPATFRLHSVFAGILLFVLLLPLSGGYFFRIYENELVRQTESELIAQGIFISAIYKDAILGEEHIPQDYGNPILLPQPQLDDVYKPVPPQLDLRTATILPPRPDAIAPAVAVRPFEATVGRRLLPILQDARISTLSSMRILNPAGIVISGTSETGLDMRNVEEVQSALKGAYTSVLRQRISDEPRPPITSISRGTDTRVFIAMPIYLRDRVIGVAYLSRSPRNILKALYEEKESVFLAALFILAMTGAIALMLSTAIGRPLRALSRHALQLAQGDKDPEKLPNAPIAEIASLMHSFEKMSLTIEARSEYIRSFAMHLAHEFKTPLTAIQGAIELLREHPHDMSPDQRARFMGNISKDTDRLKKLVTRLLELARADVMQPRHETTDLQACLQSLDQRYAGAIKLQLPVTEKSVLIGSDILETVLVNLIDNAVQIGAQHVDISMTQEDSDIMLDVTDDGPGISGNNAARLFTPFFTTRRENGGTGLGLVITKSLLKAHGGDISFNPEKSGASFRIRLVSAA
ncbi:MAG: ATP-binding protein [Micavibrio sp.]|nr:ATP-binding protein [Micavibrio sp.]